MHKLTRRDFVKSSVAAGVGLGLARAGRAAAPAIQAGSPNGDVRLAIIGLGGVDVPGSVGGRGRQLIAGFQKVPGAKIAALCDVDQAVLEHGAALLKKAGGSPATYTDVRRVLESKDIDAVVVATPNHWHALAAVWACQAGKDVYVEKPLAYNIWEGRQIVNAAKKYNRVVQVGTQARSSAGLREAFEYIRGGQLGKIRYGHVIVYRQRDGIGKVAGPTPIPSTVDYNLWCGPIAMGPINRKHLHYEWHWFWETGEGEIGNNGIHHIDMCRWGLGQNSLPRRAVSVGGRFLYDDCGETPNTNVAFLDYEAAPILVEVRGLPEKKGAQKAGTHRGVGMGFLIQCEGGYFSGNHPGGKAFDNQDKPIKEFVRGSAEDVVQAHLTNFIEAVRSRDAGRVNAPPIEGHLSTACCHVANVSYRLGAAAAPEAIREAAGPNAELSNALERGRDHLAANGVDLSATPANLGAWVTLDPGTEQFIGPLASAANGHAKRPYREPFVVPTIDGVS